MTSIRLTYGGYRTGPTTWVDDEILVAKGFSNNPSRIPKIMYEFVSAQQCVSKSELEDVEGICVEEGLFNRGCKDGAE